MKNKKLLSVFIFLLVIVAPFTYPAMAKSPEPGLPKSLVFAATPTGGSSYILCVAFADLIQKHTGMVISVEPTSGSIAQGELILRGAADFALPDDWGAWMGYNGVIDFKKIGKVDQLLLSEGRKYQIGVLVRKDSPYHSIKELKGKRVWGIVPGSPTFELQARAIFAGEGLDPDKDVRLLKQSSVKGLYTNLAEGKGEALVAAMGGSRDLDFNASVGGRWLGLSEWGPENIMRAKKEFPIASVGEFKAMPAAGVLTNLRTLSHGSNLVIAAKHSEKLAYTLISTLLENHKELIPVHGFMKEWGIDDATKDPVIPYHPGAIKYYKEKGVWNAELDRLQEQLIKNRGKK